MGCALLAAGLLATYYANFYASLRASNSVTDIILDNLPVVSVNFVFSDGVPIFISVLALILLWEPRRTPFVLKSIAVFILVRSVFLMLTHIAPPPHESYVDTTDWLYRLSSGDDLFFSAHTGLPFLLSLIFWDEKNVRYFFFLATAIGASVVLLGHLHYSIDVFSAFFIAFGIFHFCKKAFPADYRLLRHED